VQQEGALSLERTECWYSDGGNLTGALHMLRVWFAPLTPPSSLLPYTGCPGILAVKMRVW